MIQRMFVTLDTRKTNYKNVGKINHGDDLILELTVLSDGDMISFNNPMVDLLVKKSDGKMIRQNSGIEHIQPNKFIIEVKKDCVTSPGLATNQLIINDDGRISTCMFYYTILNSLEEDVIQSISSVEVLEQLDEYVIEARERMELLNNGIKELEELFGATSDNLVEAEMTRNEAEQNRAQSEILRLNNENDRIEADNIRNQNEVDRLSSELVREERESERILNEEERHQNESERMIDESTRQQNENARQSNESIRMSNENDRKTQENRRVTAETNRVNAETIRRNNENSRISNESERQKTIKEMKSLIDEVEQNENARQSNESIRMSNENDRKTQENRRVTAETNRVNAETNRVNAETTRRNNENSRISNEIERQKAMNEMKSLLEDAREFDERVGVIEDEIEEINSSLDNMKSKLSKTICLSNFKRLGGEIDDTQRLQRALDSGNIVFLNEKDIVISQKIYIKSNSFVFGIPNHTTIKASANMGEIAMIGNSGSGLWDEDVFTYASENIILKDIIIYGNRNERNLGNNPNAHSIAFAWTKNLVIENVVLNNSNGGSICLYNCVNVRINNNNILDSGANGILGLQKCKDIWVTNNLIDTTLAQNGIFFMYQNGLSSVNTYIQNNIVKNAFDFGIEVGDHVSESGEKHYNTHIVGNKLYNIGNAGISCRTVDNAYIVNNIVEGFGTSNGYGTEGIFCEGEAQLCKNLHIEGNTITQLSPNNGSMSGIFVTGYKNFIVEKNYVNGCKLHGIYIESVATPIATTDFPDKKRITSDFKLINNDISNCVGKGIRVIGYNTKNISILNNKIENCGSQGIEMSGINRIDLFDVNNNTINNCNRNGISVYLAKNGSISNNKLYNNSLTGANDNEKSNILISTVNNVVLDNDMCLDFQEIPTQKYGMTISNSSKIYVKYPNINVGGLNQYSNTDFKIVKYD